MVDLMQISCLCKMFSDFHGSVKIGLSNQNHVCVCELNVAAHLIKITAPLFHADAIHILKHDPQNIWWFWKQWVSNDFVWSQSFCVIITVW